MNLASLLRRHARAAILMVGALAAGGIVAAWSLPSSIYPELHFPRVVIIARSGTLPSQAMTVSVTRPLEQAVMEVPGIRRVRSKSLRGVAEISAQFDPATDMVTALQQVQNRVSEIRGELPADSVLTVERLTPAVFPVFMLSMTGKLATADLNDYANYIVRPEIARVPGAGKIEALASDTREIEVVLDPAKLTAARLTVASVADALRDQNILQPVGQFIESGLQHLTLASGLWKAQDDIANATVLVNGGSTIRISDLGSVTMGAPDRTLLVTGNGRDAISISISQQIGANILALKRGVDAALERLRHTLPSGIQIVSVYDLAEFVSAAIANVRDAILIGGVLAILVLLVFLRSLRLTLVAALTLPLAVLPTFLFMRWFGESINLMSMGGLAVAIGLVIDDAVVVVEGIHRGIAEGGMAAPFAPATETATGTAMAMASAEAATAAGTAAAKAAADPLSRIMSQLMSPLVCSTLTTVVVFAPLSQLSGVAGQFFRSLSLTLSVAVIMSLVVSVSVVPLMASWALRRSRSDAPPPNHAHTPGRLERIYLRGLQTMLARPVTAVLATIALALVTAGLFSIVGTGFLPAADEGGFVVDYLTPPGSALADTDRRVRALEKVIASTDDVAAYSRRTGTEMGLFATAQNTGDILVRLKPRGQRHRSANEIITDMRPKLQAAAPGTEIEFVQLLQDMLGDLEGAPTPIEVKIFGDDAETLDGIAGDVEHALGAVPGVVDVVGMQRTNPEMTWRVDAAAARRFGLSVDQVATQMSASWRGVVPTELRLLDRLVPVRVRLPDGARFDPAQMAQTLIKTGDGSLVPVAAMAAPERASGQSELLRENLRGMALVTGHLDGRDLGSVIKDVAAHLQRMKLPIGYTYEIGGQYESQRQSFRELLLVFAIAVLLVFTVLVVQFRAWLPAALILVAAPLSIGGALALLWLTGTDLNVSSAMGVILLVGLVVKNGIMLFDLAERLHEEGEPFDRAMAHAGRIRLRPILMTTCCTLFGLLPLALGLGAGADLQRPLALAVLGGLTLSTPITLLLVPGLYAAVRNFSPQPH